MCHRQTFKIPSQNPEDVKHFVVMKIILLNLLVVNGIFRLILNFTIKKV